MKINFNRVLKSYKGEALIDEEVLPDGQVKRKDLTLANTCINVLLAAKGEEGISGDKKVARFDLACKIYNASLDSQGWLDVKVEDVAMIKELVGKAYPPLIVGPAWAALDAPEVEVAVAK